MRTPLVAFLCGAPHPPSRPCLEAAARALGARSVWLDPHAIRGVDRLPERPDVAVARSGGYTDDMALAAIRGLEAAGLPCLPSADRIEVVRDKLLAARALSSAGVPVPATMAADGAGRIAAGSVDGPADSEPPVAEDATVLRFPLVVKARCGMRGESVSLVHDRAELAAALAGAPTGSGPRERHPLLLQAYVGDGTGTDLRVMVVGGRALGAIVRTPAEGDFRANAHQGAAVAPTPLTPELDGIARAATAALGLPFAGVDLMRDAAGATDDAAAEGWLVLEVNSSPGFEAFEAATGVDVAGAIVAEALRFAEAAR